MAASDLLVEVGDPGTATTLASPGYSIGGTSINVGSTTNWPSTGKAVVFAIDEAEVVDGVEQQVAGTYNEFEGTVASSTSISNVDWKRGSGDRNYSAGSLTRVYIPVSSERENRIVTWGTAEHNQDGTHSAVTADSVVVADGGTLEVDTVNEATTANGVTIDGLNIKDSKLVTSDSVVTANITDSAVTNAKLSTTAGELGGAWQDWAVSISFATEGNGTLEGRYMQVGKTVIGWAKFTLGSTSAVAAGFSFVPPVEPNSDYAAGTIPVGGSYAYDATAGNKNGQVAFNGTVRLRPRFENISAGTYGVWDTMQSNIPFTWTTNDSITINFVYEAA